MRISEISSLVVWDDGYGISVPAKFQTTKEDISEILKGFQRDENADGYEIFKVRGWDYPALCETYQKAIDVCRTEHVPVMIHVTEVTQPQGHSTSGSHERYKDKARQAFEDQDATTEPVLHTAGREFTRLLDGRFQVLAFLACYCRQPVCFRWKIMAPSRALRRLC